MAEPRPSRLAKLDQLQDMDLGTKIRFLGCVHSYDGQGACLTLHDRYPATANHTPTAVVSVGNLLESLNHELIAVGSWINVIGYLRPLPESLVHSAGEKSSRGTKRHSQPVVFVESSMIWSAGSVRTEKYDAALTELQLADNST
ncbi:hypothetical protein KC332_g17752 [Hortaea werneckii]|uniref:CST complex subunit Ten1 n=1 Tax=Hortaea werneckii TaxID=91943 RepID=A0A3M7J6D3_HORWE|nr:hypothetical protein KC350_g17924 [Hortaea werneckii]KAI6815146.1 hypothetical protein KC342_g16082 [Hortaea werneckii]KAI6831967.1 hypothetical protein KC358_g6477 [Hortaea werneckii]KAI6938640.1 hypothetical protein KC341_g4777 [Hortaea werneckii]KAI6940207.1 hypothetical protein KC348_g5086 [Hortaea werneckii]